MISGGKWLLFGVTISWQFKLVGSSTGCRGLCDALYGLGNWQFLSGTMLLPVCDGNQLEAQASSSVYIIAGSINVGTRTNISISSASSLAPNENALLDFCTIRSGLRLCSRPSQLSNPRNVNGCLMCGSVYGWGVQILVQCRLSMDMQVAVTG